MRKVTRWINEHALMLMALSMSLASSGIDGAYMSRLMVPWLAWSGYVLNTISDVAALVLANWYGRLEMRGTGAHSDQIKRVLWGEYAAIAYSWLFSWRQLRPVIYEIEKLPLLRDLKLWAIDLERVELELIAAVVAGFVPVVNGFLGYAQALRDGKFENREPQPETTQEPAPATPEPAPKPEGKREPLPEYTHETLVHFAQNPSATYRSAADALDCSPRTVSNHMAMARDAGIARRNDDGWEVLLNEMEESE